MNILTFDIEEWYLEKHSFGDHAERYAWFDGYLKRILDVLDEQNIKATFFCLGALGRDYPEVVKLIASHGHEIGCHSDKHLWLNKMTRDECISDTRLAVDSLEQCIGRKIKSYRAPAFSVEDKNKWVFEVLAECGIENDASIFPSVRDFGGYAEFGQKIPSIVRHGSSTIKEFPICTANIFGKEVAYSGGGYFRFFPLYFVMKEMAKSNYSMTYFHIDDFLVGNNPLKSRDEYESYYNEPGTIVARYKRYFKANILKRHAFDKLSKLLLKSSFINIEQASRNIDWAAAPIINIFE